MTDNVACAIKITMNMPEIIWFLLNIQIPVKLVLVFYCFPLAMRNLEAFDLKIQRGLSIATTLHIDAHYYTNMMEKILIVLAWQDQNGLK